MLLFYGGGMCVFVWKPDESNANKLSNESYNIVALKFLYWNAQFLHSTLIQLHTLHIHGLGVTVDFCCKVGAVDDVVVIALKSNFKISSRSSTVALILLKARLQRRDLLRVAESTTTAARLFFS